MNEPSHKAEPTTRLDNEQATGTSTLHPQHPRPLVGAQFHPPRAYQHHVQQEIISAAQRGDLATIQQLVESDNATVNDRDEQNVFVALAERPVLYSR